MRLRLEQALERSRLFHGFKGFDDVPDLDVVEILEAHAAFHALGHFPGVILEAFQGGNPAGIYHHAVAQQPYAGGTDDLSIRHEAAGNDSDLGQENVFRTSA